MHRFSRHSALRLSARRLESLRPGVLVGGLVTAALLAAAPVAASDSTSSVIERVQIAQASTVRDRIAQDLARYECARLDVTVDPRDHLWITGYVRSANQRAELERSLPKLAGNTPYTIGVRILGAPICEAMGVLHEAELRNGAQSDRLIVGLLQGKVMLRESDPFVIDVTVPPRDMHLYIDYFTLDGHVAHLLPGSTYSNNLVKGGSRTVLGDAQEGPWWVGPPFGRELLVAIASPTPLFAAQREEFETAADYLRDLSTAMANRDDVIAVTLPIATRAR